MPWEETEDYIRSGHGDLEKYDKESLRTIEISENEGIKAIVGCPKGQFEHGRCRAGMETVSFLFDRSQGWTMEKAKKWFEEHEKRRK